MNAAEKEELLSALKLIRAECKKHARNCDECPLSRNSAECAIVYGLPEDWDLIDDDPNWRDFRE